MITVGMIGTGKMGGALASAIAQKNDVRLLLTNRHPEKAQVLANQTGGTVTGPETVIDEADFIFLGVKPQMLRGLLDSVRDRLLARTTPFTLVSMAAGISIRTIADMLGKELPLIRIMPNIPVAVGQGLILYSCSSVLPRERAEMFTDLMEFSGRLMPVDEKLIDAGSAVSGCGPAFAAMFAEALADGGVACGLPRAQAMECAAQMMLGTAQYLLATGMHPGELKDAVCSPGGTTIQGVRTLEENGFRGSVFDAVIAAYEKTLALQ